MDFSTGLAGFKSISFPDEGTQATDALADVRNQSAPEVQPGPESQNVPGADTLPETILTSWSRIARANISVRMYDDLVRAATRPPGLRSGSLRNFLEFWSAVHDVAVEPELALAPDGTIHAEWFKSARQRLDVRFLDQKVLLAYSRAIAYWKARSIAAWSSTF